MIILQYGTAAYVLAKVHVATPRLRGKFQYEETKLPFPWHIDISDLAERPPFQGDREEDGTESYQVASPRSDLFSLG